MATTPRKGKPFVWVSWITGLLAGSNQCQWAAWYKARFKYDKVKDDFDLEAWGADHDALVRKRIGEFEADGATVKTENENWVRVSGETAVLVGKPDIVSRLGGQFVIADGKTGDPSKRDWWQMLIYLYMLPTAWKSPLRVTGEIFYKSGSRVEVHPEEFTPDRKQELFGLIRLIAANDPPKLVPSIPECARCDIAACTARMVDSATVEAITSEF